MSRTAEQETAEGAVLAPALYLAESVEVRPDGSVLIAGPPARGEVRLMSCYTPAWWYIACRACHHILPVSRDHADPRLAIEAARHRCSDPYNHEGRP